MYVISPSILMTEQQPGSAPESPRVTIDGLLVRAESLKGYKTLQKSQPKVRLFATMVRTALNSKKINLKGMDEVKRNNFLVSLIRTVNLLSEEEIAKGAAKKSTPKKTASVARETGQKVQDVVQPNNDEITYIGAVQDTTDPTQVEGGYDVQFVDNLVDQATQGITFGEVRDQVPEVIYIQDKKASSRDSKNTVPENDGLTALKGLNLDGTDFRSLNHEQQVAFANMIAVARKAGWTTERLNDDRAKLMQAIAKAKETTAPRTANSASEWTSRHTAVATAATLIFGIPLAVGAVAGGAYLLSDNDQSTPAVAPSTGVTTFDMPSASREVISVGGGFTALLRADGILELTSKDGNTPKSVSFYSDNTKTFEVKQGLIPAPGTQTYHINTNNISDFDQMSVQYHDTSTNGVHETDPVRVQ